MIIFKKNRLHKLSNFFLPIKRNLKLFYIFRNKIKNNSQKKTKENEIHFDKEKLTIKENLGILVFKAIQIRTKPIIIMNLK